MLRHPSRWLQPSSASPFFSLNIYAIIRTLRKFLEKADPHLVVVVAFGHILVPEFFDYPSLGTLNVHASLLPRYRGAAPVVHTLLNGERETGVTIMKIDEGMDTGAILSQSKLEVGSDTNAAQLEGVLARRGS